ncbi:MAG: hypothetical protein Q4F05_19885, partial [bacterium]|nr:hypothetical protein [bacterium]
ATGPAGETGATGATGPAGTTSGSNLLVNGGMETFTDSIPDGWTGPGADESEQENAVQGLIHSGQSAVKLKGKTGITSTSLSQRVAAPYTGCSYKCIFNAKCSGTTPALLATMTFYNTEGAVVGTPITLQMQEGSLPSDAGSYGTYFFMTPLADETVTEIEIKFDASGLDDNAIQNIYLDDVFLFN